MARDMRSTYLATRNTAPGPPDTIFLRSTSTTTNYRSDVAVEAGAGELKRRIALLLDRLTYACYGQGSSRAGCQDPRGRIDRSEH